MDYPQVKKTLDGERLMSMFERMVDPLGAALPSSCEIVLHDFSKLPSSIVAIHGTLTGRKPGDPITDLLLRQAVNDDQADSIVGYTTHAPDGRRLWSSTFFVRDSTGQLQGALCVNVDVSQWEAIERIARAILPPGVGEPLLEGLDLGHTDPAREQFVSDLNELSERMLTSCIEQQNTPVSSLKKHQKVEIVRNLRERGFFMLKEATDLVADALKVSKFTIYNYLNEIESGAGGS
ncbi:helix-turn-helix transcriptional regulator [Gordonia sp. DT219]|uniref:helix-turn-helix transcriptional regulator n=1 Tax=Gordonia sp. DT219 TaxID=3416658 RepID=UPI003CF1BF54